MTTTLNSILIADPFEQSIEREANASVLRSANGTLHIDYLTTNLDGKVKIKLKWRLLTSSERNTLKTRIEDCIGNTRLLVLPDSQLFNVRLDPETVVTELSVKTALGIRYNIDVTFIKV